MILSLQNSKIISFIILFFIILVGSDIMIYIHNVFVQIDNKVGLSNVVLVCV